MTENKINKVVNTKNRPLFDEFYDLPKAIDANASSHPVLRGVFFQDSPHNAHPYAFETVKVIASFRDYCRFKPNGDDSIFVTLGIINWNCDGESPYMANLSVNSVVGPLGPFDSNAFPTWQYIVPGGSK